MISPLLLAALVFVCATLSISGAMIAALYPRISRRAEFQRRLESLVEISPRTPVQGAKQDEGKRRQQSIEKTLRQLDQNQRAAERSRSRPGLAVRLQQARLGWSRTKYTIVCIIAGACCLGLGFVVSGSPLIALALAPAGGLILPHLYIERRRKARFKKFGNEFPGAVDVIVRGIKSGLPVGDCMRIIATEAPEPVRSEFKTLIDDQVLGMPIDQAVQRLAERVPLTETNFFSIVITIQSRTGGNLSEVLSNLTRVLRERKKMEHKIKAMSAEAKSSAAIIGCLPVVVGGLVYLSSPDYISLLFTTPTGNIVMVGSGLWMLMGVLLMRKMINFDF